MQRITTNIDYQEWYFSNFCWWSVLSEDPCHTFTRKIIPDTYKRMDNEGMTRLKPKMQKVGDTIMSDGWQSTTSRTVILGVDGVLTLRITTDYGLSPKQVRVWDTTTVSHNVYVRFNDTGVNLYTSHNTVMKGDWLGYGYFQTPSRFLLVVFHHTFWLPPPYTPYPSFYPFFKK